MHLEYVFKLRDHLGCELLLLQIVTAFYDTADQTEIFFSRQVSKVVLLSHFHANLAKRFLTEQAMWLL